MKKLLMALCIVGLLTSGCGEQPKPADPKPAQSEEKPNFEPAVEPVKEAADAAKDKVEAVANDAKDAAQSAATDAKDAAQGVATDAQNMANDVKDAAQGVATDAQNAASNVVDTARDLLPSVELPEMISTAPSIGATREMFEAYGTDQYEPTYDEAGRIVSMAINTEYIDNDTLASILPSDVKITSFDTDSSDATRQVNHFQGTSEQLKKINPKSDGKFEAFTNFDRQTSQFLGGTISVK